MQTAVITRREWSRRLGITSCFVLAAFLSFAARADAFHLFRGDELEVPNCDPGCNLPSCSVDSSNIPTCCSAAAGNPTQPICCPATGNLGDTTSNIGAVVDLLHYSFHDAATLVPAVVRIAPGEAVRWRWSSSHCHSVTADDGSFDSGFVFPLTPPAGQSKVIKGFFDYPIPDDSPSLTFTHIFTTPGVYTYHCVHHQIVGMEGVVVVEALAPPPPPALP